MRLYSKDKKVAFSEEQERGYLCIGSRLLPIRVKVVENFNSVETVIEPTELSLIYRHLHYLNLKRTLTKERNKLQYPYLS